MYSTKFIDIFTNPKNVGIIQGASGVGTNTNETTNDVMKLYVKIENETIVDAKFKTYSSAVGIVALSVLTEMLKGKTLEEALKIEAKDLLAEIGSVENDKLYMIDDALKTLSLAIADYRKKQEKLLQKLANANK